MNQQPSGDSRRLPNIQAKPKAASVLGHCRTCNAGARLRWLCVLECMCLPGGGGTSFTRRQGLAVDTEVRTSPNANLAAFPGASPLKIIATGQNKLPYTYPRAFKGRARVRRPFYNVISNTEAFGDSTGFCATGWAGRGPLFLSRIHWGPFGYRARPSVR